MRSDELAAALLAGCRSRRVMLATAESCTGGLIAAALTAIPGSSDVVERGFVTYSNAAKTELIGVPPLLIQRFGAVSEEVARSMAEGALAHAPAAGLSIAVTGIAGPGGGTPEKPVGLVFLSVATRRAGPRVERCVFAGDRTQIREASVLTALTLALSHLDST